MTGSMGMLRAIQKAMRTDMRMIVPRCETVGPGGLRPVQAEKPLRHRPYRRQGAKMTKSGFQANACGRSACSKEWRARVAPQPGQCHPVRL